MVYDQAAWRPIQIFAIDYDYWYEITKADGDLEEGEQPKLNENGEQYMIAWTDCGYFDSYMQLRFGGLTVKSAIRISYGNDIRISVDNAYKEYQVEPDSLQKVLNKCLAVASELYSPREKINIERIVLIIKPISYLNEIKKAASKMGATKDMDIEGVYEKYNDQLIIAYAEDTKNSIRYLTHGDIKSLSVSKDSIKQIAIKNLDKLLTSIKRKGGDGVYMLTAGGDYEASIILLDNVLTKESLPVNGDFVIAIPNRDILLITGSNDNAGILKIKEIAKKSFETGNYQVSEYLYKWNGKTFEKYE